MSTNTTSPGAAPQEAHLSRVLGPLHLWALAVGLVISGNYFGWSYGMESGGPMGLLYALIPVTLFYVTFMLSYSELATMIPHAGGPSAYARRAMGTFGGYMNGISCLIEFVFAPPAIAMAIGAYLNVQFPGVDPKVMAACAYLVFMALNIVGVRIAANFELVVTVLAIIELLVFMGVVSPGFSMAFLRVIFNSSGTSLAMRSTTGRGISSTRPTSRNTARAFIDP